MNLTIAREPLLSAVTIATRAISRESQAEDLLFAVREGNLHITGMGPKMQTTVVMDVADCADGAVRLHSLPLLEFVRGLPPRAAVRIESHGKRATISSGRSESTLKRRDAETFPLVAPFDVLSTLEIPDQLLLSLLSRTAFAMAFHDIRFRLCALLLEVHPEKVICVASDSKRLSIASAAVTTGIAQACAIIPNRVVTEVMDLLDGSDRIISVGLGASHIRFLIGPVIVTGELAGGPYPPYQTVVPTEFKQRAHVDRERFKEAILRVRCKYSAVKLTTHKDQVSFSTSDRGKGTLTEQMSAVTNGADVTVLFCPEQMLDALAATEGERVAVSIGEEGAPILISGCDSARVDHVLMPVLQIA
jgi:DNA polymerase III subunit beta